MSGNIYQRKDGRFEGRISLGKSETGKRLYRSFFVETQNEVISKMARFRQNIAPKHALPLSFKEIFVRWKIAIRSRIKESTFANYQMKAEKHIIPQFGTINIESITGADVRQFAQT